MARRAPAGNRTSAGHWQPRPAGKVRSGPSLLLRWPRIQVRSACSRSGSLLGSGHGTGGNSVTLKQVSEVRSIGSARKDLQRCRLGVHMHGPSLSGMSGTAVGGPGSPHSDSVFRSNTSTDQTNRDQTRFGWRRGAFHLHSPLPARSRKAGSTVRRGRPFAAGVPRHLQRHREHLAAARIHTPLGRQARRRCSIPQRYFSMVVS